MNRIGRKEGVAVCLSALIMMLYGCKDIIEPSLEKRTVVLRSPVNGAESNKYQVGFWWEPVNDAIWYRLQIATPDFISTVSLIQDTLIKGLNKHQLTLEPGKYAWRLRAENGSSTSGYATAAFTIYESSLKEQQVTLTMPGNNYLSNQSTVTLGWDKLFGATTYLLQIDNQNFADETKLIYNQPINGNQYLFTFPADGTYQWRVNAQNGTEISKWSAVRLMSLDKTPPGTSTPLSPVKGAQVNQPVSISWTAVATAKKYKLYLYKSDGTTNYTTGFPATVTGTIYTFNVGQTGELIYWRVIAIDESGNEGAMSELMNFTIQ